LGNAKAAPISKKDMTLQWSPESIHDLIALRAHIAEHDTGDIDRSIIPPAPAFPSSASPRTHDCGSDVIVRRRAGVAQRAALAIEFVKNVLAICADPIAVEASNRQESSIRKGESLCLIINYKT
jgi:hypothetical protein